MSAYQDYISTYNGSPLTYNGSWLSLHVPKPSALAPYTVRFEFVNSAYDPTSYQYHWASGGTWTRVSSDPNVWDFTCRSATYWSCFNVNNYSLLPSCKIIDANLRDVPVLHNSFRGQSNITSVNLGDLWSLQMFDQPFTGCTSLTDFVIGDIGELSSASYIETNIGDGSFIPAQSSIERFQISDCYKDMHWVSDSVHRCPYLESVTIGTQYATTSIHTMFKRASGSSKGLTITLGDMPLVEDASQAFRSAGASSQTYLMDSEVFLNLGAMPSVTDTDEMFAYSYIFGNAPSMDLSNVTRAYHMFEGSHFSSAPRYDMPVCTNAERMFASCPELTEAPLLHINSACNIAQIFDSKDVQDGLQESTQHPCELFAYYCHPNMWAQYSTGWMDIWFRLHPEITEQNPNEIYRYYYSDNSWNSTTYTSMALASVSQNVNGQEDIPKSWYND